MYAWLALMVSWTAMISVPVMSHDAEDAKTRPVAVVWLLMAKLAVLGVTLPESPDIVTNELEALSSTVLMSVTEIVLIALSCSGPRIGASQFQLQSGQ
eukprot:3647895-Rhodomonas_salina.1